MFRDLLNNQEHTITQNAKGEIKAIAEWETKSGKKFPLSGYNSKEKAGNELIYGTKGGEESARPGESAVSRWIA